MKIYSWNMLYRNKELDRAFEFIAKSDFDIFCLQEVPEEFLKRLQTLPCFIAPYIERELLLKRNVVYNYVVILSKYPIEAQGEIPFPDYSPLLPFRTRLFAQFMPSKFFADVREGTRNRNALFVDVRVPNASSTIRILNLHLILAQPAWRLKEFEMAMEKRDPSRPTIVCGDFNTLETRHTTLLNWLFGGKVSDALLHQRERTHIEQRFVEHELQNPLRGSITHPFSRSQLDHILVSHSFSIKNAEVLPDRIGSDHHPICVEVE